MLKGLRLTANAGTLQIARLVINGRWELGTSSRFLEIVSPATEAIVGHVPMANRADAERAVVAAQSARASIARLSVWERARTFWKQAYRAACTSANA
jgi:acyl-CoA reductase-like NAD-dependent aldehyde dehydrogenase